MDHVLEVWRRLAPRSRLIAVLGPVVVVATVAGASLAAVTGRPGPVAVIPSSSPDPTTAAIESGALPPDPTLDPAASLEPSPTPPPPGADPLLGTDGRLTVLLLGSDYRPAHPGNRTDAIMVVSVDPSTGKAAGFSIPRDAVNFPLIGGGHYSPKVNGLYQHLQSTTGNGGVSMSKAINAAFKLEIDGYVFIGFSGVQQLVASVGGVDVHLDKAYYDAEYWVNSHHQGWGLPAGTSHLGPADALIFARSRKGDNDFGRARRQQMLVLAAIDKARSRGIGELPRLLRIASGTVRTNLPLNRANDLFGIVSRTDISTVDRVVFGPRTFADAIGGSAFQLDLATCRAWITAHFPPARPMGQWPLASAAPAPSP